MMRSLNTSATGMVAQQMNLDVIANNLANVNTTAFKHQRAEFQDLMYQTVQAAGSFSGDNQKTPTAIQLGLGTRNAATSGDFTQGAALQTGLAYARSRPGARYFVMFDADGQHRLEDASAMLEVARSGEADVVLGTRFAEHADSVPLLKRIVLRTAVLLSPAGRKLKLTDAHNGLRVLTRPVADDLRITMNGMAHASEIVSYLGRSSWRVREVPVSIQYTEYSRSKGQSLLNGVNILFDLSVRQRGG